MHSAPVAWWGWLLFLGIGLPWLVPIVWFWHRRPRDGAIPQSMADRARERLPAR